MGTELTPTRQSHRRRNALTGDWLLVSPYRFDRPWQGEELDGSLSHNPGVAHDANCYLCAGNGRADGTVNPDYQGVYVFNNDFPALQLSTDELAPDTHPLFEQVSENGVCRVMCFSPHHSRTLSHLNADEVTGLVTSWAQESQELGELFPDGSIQIFENKGEVMGCSQPHPHCQIWAQRSVPTELARELQNSQEYRAEYGRVLLTDYVNEECERAQRIVFENDDFVVVVPYWASWPFETLICPRRQMARLTELSSGELRSFADTIRRLSILYDRLFGVSFPYSSGIHQAPANGNYDDSFTMHMHFYPPLLRSAGVKKFMVGYEMLSEAQRDLTPEAAAKKLQVLAAEKQPAVGTKSASGTT